MFRRSQAQPCYPEAGHPDGCFPDNARTPSPFECWIAGVPDRISLEGLAQAASKRPSRPAAARRRSRPDR